jgi:hypothetical protein
VENEKTWKPRTRYRRASDAILEHPHPWWHLTATWYRAAEDGTARFLDRVTATHKALVVIVVTVIGTWSARGCYQDWVNLPADNQAIHVRLDSISTQLREIRGNRFTSGQGEALRHDLQQLTLELVKLQGQFLNQEARVAENHTRIERLEDTHGFQPIPVRPPAP